jgi:hypothetical protein
MKILQDLLNELQLSPVLRERVALADQRYEQADAERAVLKDANAALKRRVADLERENAELRAQIPARPANNLGADTARVLAHLFKVAELGDRHVRPMAQALEMERGMLQYHLERLDDKGLAVETGAFQYDDVCWGITPEGRRYAVENGLI